MHDINHRFICKELYLFSPFAGELAVAATTPSLEPDATGNRSG
jgi:hypothetical protein